MGEQNQAETHCSVTLHDLDESPHEPVLQLLEYYYYHFFFYRLPIFLTAGRHDDDHIFF